MIVCERHTFSLLRRMPAHMPDGAKSMPQRAHDYMRHQAAAVYRNVQECMYRYVQGCSGTHCAVLQASLLHGMKFMPYPQHNKIK